MYAAASATYLGASLYPDKSTQMVERDLMSTWACDGGPALGYPDRLFEDLVAHSNIRPGGRVLEIGCGTGQATIPLAERGFHIMAIELGTELSRLAREKLARYSSVKVITGRFEDVDLDVGAFDLVFSAQAFHWIDPQVGFSKVAAA